MFVEDPQDFVLQVRREEVVERCPFGGGKLHPLEYSVLLHEMSGDRQPWYQCQGCGFYFSGKRLSYPYSGDWVDFWANQNCFHPYREIPHKT